MKTLPLIGVSTGIAAVTIPLGRHYPLAAKLIAAAGVLAIGGFNYMLYRATRGNLRKDVSITLPFDVETAVKNKNILVVGGTAGVGLAIANRFQKYGSKVTVVGRRSPVGAVEGIFHNKSDLSTVKQMENMANCMTPKEYDLVLFTQGILAASTRQVTEEGIEMDMAVSYLSRFVIANNFISRGYDKPIFVMGFPGATRHPIPLDDLNAEKKYVQMPQHMVTVALNDALVLNLARKYPHIPVAALGPGMINTDIRSNFYGSNKVMASVVETFLSWFTITADEYAEGIVPTLAAYLVGGHKDAPNGLFFNQSGQVIKATDFMLMPETLDEAWTQTEKLIEKAKASHK